MAKILVNPTSLKSSAKQISTVSTLIQKAGESAWNSASGAPSYEGQFGPKVHAIAQAALTRAKKQSASAKTLSSSLNKRASAFEAADAAAVKGLLKKAGTFTIYDPLYLRILAKLLGLTIAQILVLLRLGGLLLPIRLIPKLPWWFIPPWKPFLPLIPPKIPRPVPAPKPPLQPKPVPPMKPPLPPIPIPEPKPAKKWPDPPTHPVLKTALWNTTKWCVEYARARRPDLGSTQSDRERYRDEAAANYICKFEEKAFQITNDDVSNEEGGLTNIIGVGYAVVWEPGVGGYDKTYGHVAIVEEVYPDRIVISHDGPSVTQHKKTIYINDLTKAWLIP